MPGIGCRSGLGFESAMDRMRGVRPKSELEIEMEHGQGRERGVVDDWVSLGRG